MNSTSSLKSVDLPPSLAEVAFKAIKDAIIAGRLEPTKVHSEQALAKELGFSKTPVHEALTSLAAKGFVEILPRRGFKIITLTQAKVAQMFEFRIPLELLVIHRITAKLTPRDLNRIKEYLAGMKVSRDPAKFQQYDRSFHRLLASLTNNLYIINALNDIWDLCDWVGASVLHRQGRYELAVEEHAKIARHLKSGDVQKAAKAMEAHLLSTQKKFVNSFEQPPGSS